MISPLVVTVGLSLSIPLSLIGQMIIDAQYSSPLYWIGAAIVVLSFIFINNEEAKEQDIARPEEAPVLPAAEGEANLQRPTSRS